ncbi:MAG: hypothetical protein ACRCZI_02665 [Cetobacterium sp.]
MVFAAHQSVLAIKYKEKSTDNTTDTIMTNINRKGGNIIYDDENIKVVPKFKEYEIPQNTSHVVQEHKEPTTAAEILDELEQS